MMLEYIGEKEAAGILLEAMKKTMENDLQSLEAGKMGCGTTDVGDSVVRYIQ
jgi:3-isopropylmalate dehydrogenase